jgi:hypothetical protein
VRASLSRQIRGAARRLQRGGSCDRAAGLRPRREPVDGAGRQHGYTIRLLERLQPAQLVAQVEQTVHGFADRKLIGDDDPGMLLITPLKKSPEYRKVRAGLAGPAPFDSWDDERLHYFVFQIRPEAYVPEGAEPPVALFALRRDEPEPASALVITARPGAEDAEVEDLRQPGSVYTVLRAS